jgi:hypothetical protein
MHRITLVVIFDLYVQYLSLLSLQISLGRFSYMRKGTVLAGTSKL